MKYRGRVYLLLLSVTASVIEIILRLDNDSLDYIFDLAFTAIAWYVGGLYDRLKFFSEKDFLTSLYNRRFVDNFVPKILKKASSKTKKVSLLVIDVNHFKKLNDTFGHYKGDMALKKIAECLKKNIRSSDIVARWGGDEFLIIAPDMDKISAEAFSKEIERTFFNEMGEEFKNIIDLSIGQATFPDDAQTFDELLSLADNNMYTVKYRKRLKL